MDGIGITLIVIGLVFLIGSFLVKDKLSSRDIKQISDLSEEELKIIVEKQLKNANDKIETMIDEQLDESKAKVQRAMELESNEKIMSISEYSDTVLESMNKTHNEIMFLYSMLNDKHKDLTDLANQLQDFSNELKNMGDDTMMRLTETAAEIEQKVADVVSMDETQILEASLEDVTTSESLTNHNEHILMLHKIGKSDIEIAKELGLGLGEVKLVIGLFKEDVQDEI